MKKKHIMILIIILLVAIAIGVISYLLISSTSKSEPENVTITFHDENGAFLRTTEIEKETLLEQWDPEDTDGFIGWFTDNDEIFDFTRKVMEDTNLYAKYDKEDDGIIYHLVTFLVDNEFYQSLEVPAGDTIEEPETPTKEGYTFVGWYENDELFDFSQSITSEHTISAVFTQNN